MQENNVLSTYKLNHGYRWHGISLESQGIYPGTSLIAYPWNGSAQIGNNNKVTLPILLNISTLKCEGIMMIRSGHMDVFYVNHSWHKNNSLNSNKIPRDFKTGANGGDLKSTSVYSVMRCPKVRAHKILKPLYFGLSLYNISVGVAIFIRHTLANNHWTLVQICGCCKIYIISYLPRQIIGHWLYISAVAVKCIASNTFTNNLIDSILSFPCR